MRKVLIATGGTAGHLFPAKQLKALLDQERVIFAGHGLKNSPFFDQDLPFEEIISASSIRKWLTLIKGTWAAIKLILKFQPDVVVGFGSFHSFPPLLAAAILRKKIILFEPNYKMGIVNRFFAKVARKIAFQFPVSHPKAAYVPLLPWINLRKRSKTYPKEPGLVTILVFGGSQGAQFINETFFEASKLLSFPHKIIHLIGKKSPPIAYTESHHLVLPFEEEMDAAYEAADIVVCRSGAGTVAEIFKHQKPALLIPYPYAYNHQIENGQFLQNGVKILEQHKVDAKVMAEEIESLFANLSEHKKAFSQIKLPPSIAFSQIIREVIQDS